MRKRTYLLGAVAVTSGLLAGGFPALADSADNDGVNVGNDNNISVLPVQACGNDIAVLGAVVKALSASSTNCVNAPIVDHPQNISKPKPLPPLHEKPEKPFKPVKPAKPVQPGQQQQQQQPQQVTKPAKVLPTAPAAQAVQGHAAVTG